MFDHTDLTPLFKGEWSVWVQVDGRLRHFGLELACPHCKATWINWSGSRAYYCMKCNRDF